MDKGCGRGVAGLKPVRRARIICENLRNLWMKLEKDQRSTDFSDFRRSRSLPATRNITARHTKDAQWSFIPGKHKESPKDAKAQSSRTRFLFAPLRLCVRRFFLLRC